MHPQISADSRQHQQRNVGCNTAGILQPLANIKANQIQDYRNSQQSQ
jgi:hypothetical protein